jgi:hypothetical protein
VPPGAVDIVDFDTRAREFNEATAHLERVGDEEISALLEEGTRLHHLWRYDPAAAVRGHPRLSGLFDSYRGRHRRFGTRLVRSLLRAGEGDQAEDILDQYFERYPGHEALRGLEVELRRTSSRHVAIRVGDGAALFPGPAARSPALAEVRERLAATNTLPFAQLALGPRTSIGATSSAASRSTSRRPRSWPKPCHRAGRPRIPPSRWRALANE